MKRLFLGMLLLVGASSYANSGEEWIKSQLNGRQKAEFVGQTQWGFPCALYLTDKSFDDDKHYFVVVGYHNSSDLEDYIGMANTSSTVQQTGVSIKFESPNSWGNKSLWNKVDITLNSNGKPILAIGKSDRKDITCRIH